jgi:hypothetical protein
MAAFFAFVLTPLGRMLAGAGGVLLLVVAFGSHQRGIGAAKAVAKIEKATNHAVNQARRAGNRSKSGGGMLNLPYRD